MLDDQTSFSLKYYIYSEESEDKETLYGLIIDQTGAKAFKSRSKPFLKNEDEAIELALLYAKEFVFPCSLEDLIFDLI